MGKAVNCIPNCAFLVDLMPKKGLNQENKSRATSCFLIMAYHRGSNISFK